MTARSELLHAPRVLSLFAGIGGIDLGLEAHGCVTTAYSEIDPYAASMMARHFPNAVNLGDITTIDWNEANEQHGPFDIICGGFPCQDISLAGAGRGIVEGSRSGLWRQYADAIRELRPRGVLVENVAALLARGIDRVLGDLAACGFDAEWDCIPAAALGAPHLRDRVFICAYRPDAGNDVTHGQDHQQGEQEGDGGEPAMGLPSARTGSRVDAGAASQGVPELGRGAGPVGPHASDPDSIGWQRTGSGAGEAGRRRSPNGGTDVADADGERGGARGTRRAAAQSEGWIATWPTPTRRDQWVVEPDVGRVADGVPARMDRLKCLGNAVVPQVADHVAGILIDRMEAA